MLRMVCAGLLTVFIALSTASSGRATISDPQPANAPPLASTPADPSVPPLVPQDGAAPPVLALELPGSRAGLMLRGILAVFSAAPLGGASGVRLLVPPGPPDLIGLVNLPAPVSLFPGRGARPFGGSPPSAPPDGDSGVVPEPQTAVLVLLGLSGLAVAGRKRS
ncbi:MAG: PEP-CTERM sorting domain-containing protein [Myxococcales bacterium]|nr:PEP-CTERM sorting domain-containing protein [Myxococcales bacterium]MDH5305557.1 PEP-CTERM sorting domain-containing protein [Myxococcales bacterium]MDH5565202.1 PEP-CTERM sorting domain-containing protein [Myxococcales bacterium]